MTAEKKRFWRNFVVIAAIQAIGFPLVSRLFGLGDRLHSPSWVVVVITAALMAGCIEAAAKAKQS